MAGVGMDETGPAETPAENLRGLLTSLGDDHGADLVAVVAADLAQQATPGL